MNLILIYRPNFRYYQLTVRRLGHIEEVSVKYRGGPLCTINLETIIFCRLFPLSLFTNRQTPPRTRRGNAARSFIKFPPRKVELSERVPGLSFGGRRESYGRSAFNYASDLNDMLPVG